MLLVVIRHWAIEEGADGGGAREHRQADPERDLARNPGNVPGLGAGWAGVRKCRLSRWTGRSLPCG